MPKKKKHPVNYCPVCRQEYKGSRGYQTGRCPVCGSTLVLLQDEELDQIRRTGALTKE